MSAGALLLASLLAASCSYAAWLLSGRRLWSFAGTLLTLGGLVILSAGLVIRGTRADHWPLTNRFEFALGTVWSVLAFYLLAERSTGCRASGAFVLPQARLLALWAARRPDLEQAIRPLPPALQTAWFPLHVACLAIAYGWFAVAGGFGLMFLARGWLDRRGLVATAAPSVFPSLEQIEYRIWRAVGLGFPWLTLGILIGGIWAQVAWGRYWDWDPKESWTLVTWLTFLILLHGRALQGWRARRVAVLAVLGMGAVAFTFLGVDWLVQTLRLESLHVF